MGETAQAQRMRTLLTNAVATFRSGDMASHKKAIDEIDREYNSPAADKTAAKAPEAKQASGGPAKQS
jgi:hypothetical protein